MNGVLVALPIAVIAAPVARDSGDAMGAFTTPSGNIVCTWEFGRFVTQPLLACGIATRLRPAPPRSGAACKHLDYVANRISLTRNGHATPVARSGDAGPMAFAASAKMLGFGRTWRGGGFSCSSRQAGLTCTNARGHGFFLGRSR
ncbi:MAG: DUF6636 domain-containing protein [Gaiellaceae bacterium]